MTSNKPTDIQMIKRILAELAKYGSPEELVRQLNLNTTLDERNHELQAQNDSLTRTRNDIQARIQEFQEQEREALKRRDDAYEQLKEVQRNLTSKTAELESLLTTFSQRLKTTEDWESIQQRMQEENAKLQNTIASSKELLAGAAWVRSVLERNRPELWKQEKEYVIKYVERTQPEPFDWTGEQILAFIIHELEKRRTLVPITLYWTMQVLAREWADRLQKSRNAYQTFFAAPQNMTQEHRRTFLVGLIEAGVDTKEKIDELRRMAENLGAYCPTHRIKLCWHEIKRSWICPTPQCPFAV